MNSFHFYRQNNNNNDNNNNINNNNNYNYNNNNKKRNVLSKASYFTANVREPEYKCINYKFHENNYLQRSFSADNVVIRSRGFKPSDIRDPEKKRFLENLTTKILHVDMEPGEAKRIDLQKLLTPANDTEEFYHAKNKKMYASSYFYAPSHPTVEDQVELARRISHSLSDVKNMKSKGQSMYVNRKKRSVKWIHDGNGLESEDDNEGNSPIYKDKLPLKCVMNPKGKVLDIHGIQALGEEVNIEEKPSHPEKLFDIVRDLNNQKGRGAEIFAKRRKRSEKWVVDKDHRSQTAPQTPSGIPWKAAPYTPNSGKNKQEFDVKENNSSLPPLEALQPLPKPFYNPFTLDISLSPSNGANSGRGNGYSRYSSRVKVGNSNSSTTREGRNGRLRSAAVEPPEFEQYFDYSDRRSSYDHSVDCRYEKPRKQHSSVKRYNKQMMHQSGNHQISERRAVSSRNNKYYSVSRAAPYGNEMIYKNGGNLMMNSSNLTGENIRNRGGGGPFIERYNGGHDDYEDYDYEEDEDEDEEEEDDDDEEDGFDAPDNKKDDYTPVPVKELIKEFEKSCRPSMQYKRNGSGKIAAQLCALDSEAISRYFEGRGYASNSTTNRNNGDNGRSQNEWKEARRRDQNPQALINREDEEHQSAITDSRRCLAVNKAQEDPRQRDWRIKYIENGDEEEDDDEDDETSTADDSSDSSCSPNQNLIGSFDDNQSYFPVRNEFPFINYSDDYRDEEVLNDICNKISQTNGDETNKQANNNTPILIDNNDKSLVLAMVASEEDIMNTLKHLRRTPVLNNLIPETGSTDLSKTNGEVDSKLYENSEYQGPKLNSYQRLSNYNTAPRGWDQGQTYYRPVTFGRPTQDAIVYSDF